MYIPSTDRKPILSSQLAIRVAIVGGVTLALFSVVFFRLWFLQILSGDKYLSEAKNNQIRELKVEAPRGEVLDRKGRVLVDNRTALQVEIVPQRLPRSSESRRQLFQRLGRVLGMSPARIRMEYRRQLRQLPFGGVTLKTDVPLSTVWYLQEHQQEFPGVSAKRVFLRRYPYKSVAAHLFGYVSEVSPEQLKKPRFNSVEQGDRVGQTGLELVYDRYLRGLNGATRIQVDAMGRPRRELAVKEPVAGRNLRLSIDLETQRAAEEAIVTGVEALGSGSAAVALDPNDGSVLALASYPTFDPNVFSKPISEEAYKRLADVENGAALVNRAIQGAYPTGSAFKLITATAALENGILSPGSVIFDGGGLTVGGITFKNAGGASYGSLTIAPALKVSSDVFFYTVGLRADLKGGNIIQKWARRLGLGHRTGIDLPAESSGRVPSKRWRDRLFKEKDTDRPWTPGDNINLAVGQGDLQADPLQMAVAYSAIANGGYVVKPHIGQRIEDANGQVIQQIDAPPRRKLNIKESTRETIMQGLNAAATEPGGTSEPVFSGFKVPVAGKTGTAERPGQGDQSWYVVMAPYPNPEIVVAVTIESGGFGAETAAPAARRILATYFDVKDKKEIEGGTAPD